MKHTKKMMAVLLTSVAMFSFGGCSVSENDIAETVNNSVMIPEQYSIAYEIESANGITHTVKKVKNSEGNIYFQSGNEEILFIAENDHYVLYEKDAEGHFTASDNSSMYNDTYVNAETVEFLKYAEQSKDQFIPGIECNGEKEILGRDCLSYSVKIGTNNTAVTYSFLVDQETGICMEWREEKQIGGIEKSADSDLFTCTGFVTENIFPLQNLILDDCDNSYI